DPNGDGTGGPPGPGAADPGLQFADEFNSAEIFSGNGQLAMANSGKDTNGSQFFITINPQRALDFNHTTFGQLVRGFDVLAKIQAVPLTQQSAFNTEVTKPVTPIVISQAQIIQDTTDAVLTVRATGPVSSTITVTVNDGTGNIVTRNFQVQG